MGSRYRRTRVTVALAFLIILFPWSSSWSTDRGTVFIPLAEGGKLPARYFLPGHDLKTSLPGIIVAAPAGAARYIQYQTYCSKLADHNYAVLLFDAANLTDDCAMCPRCWRRIPYSILSWCNNILVALRLGFGYDWYLQTVPCRVRLLDSFSPRRPEKSRHFRVLSVRQRGHIGRCGGS